MLVEDVEKTVRESPAEVRRRGQVSLCAQMEAPMGSEARERTHRKKRLVIRPKAKYSWPLVTGPPVALTPVTAAPPAIVVVVRWWVVKRVLLRGAEVERA